MYQATMDINGQVWGQSENGHPVKRRVHIAPGYMAYNGAIITARATIESYNRLQDEINGRIDAGLPVSEWLLDASHKFFVMMCDVAKGTLPCC